MGKKNADGKPKRALPAYMFFATKMRPTVVLNNPNMKFGEVGAELGRQWREMDETAKQPYHELAAQDKKRYEAEYAEWQEMNPNARGRKKKVKKVVEEEDDGY